MALNIQELIALADYLDEEGRHDDASEIDEMVQKLAATMVEEDNDEGFKKQLREEGWESPQVYVGKKEPYVEPTLTTKEMPLEQAKEEFSEFLAQLEQAGISPQAFFNVMGITGGMQLEKDPDTGRWETKKEASENTIDTMPKHEIVGQLSGEEKSKLFDKLAGVADKLDSVGAVDEAGLIDGFIQKHADDVLDYKGEDPGGEQSKRYDSKHHHSLQIREPKTKQERVDREGREKHHADTMQGVEASALNTRYCPEHIGVTVGRVGELTYQCPIDGAVYNWETGWVDHDGKEHPGGSVAGQTPESSGYAINHRIFDSRENTLNRVN